MDIFVKRIFSFLSLIGIEIHIVLKFRSENHSLHLNLKALKEFILKITSIINLKEIQNSCNGNNYELLIL